MRTLELKKQFFIHSEISKIISQKVLSYKLILNLYYSNMFLVSFKAPIHLWEPALAGFMDNLVNYQIALDKMVKIIWDMS